MIFVVLEVFHLVKKRHEKRAAKKRPLLPDPRFNDQLVTFCEQLNVGR
jgi:hypothetical protein